MKAALTITLKERSGSDHAIVSPSSMPSAVRDSAVELLDSAKGGVVGGQAHSRFIRLQAEQCGRVSSHCKWRSVSEIRLEPLVGQVFRAFFFRCRQVKHPVRPRDVRRRQ